MKKTVLLFSFIFGISVYSKESKEYKNEIKIDPDESETGNIFRLQSIILSSPRSISTEPSTVYTDKKRRIKTNSLPETSSSLNL